MVLVAVTYQIWRARNGAYWNMKVNRIDCIVKEIKCIVVNEKKKLTKGLAKHYN